MGKAEEIKAMAAAEKEEKELTREAKTMKTVTGVCKICNNSVIIQVPADWHSEEAIDEYATMQCNCKEGSEYRHQEAERMACIDAIKIYTEPLKEEGAGEILIDAIKKIQSGAVKSITVKTQAGTYNMSKKDAKIELSRKEVIENDIY